MKKHNLILLIMLFSLMPLFAQESSAVFVPSIEAKSAPEVIEVTSSKLLLNGVEINEEYDVDKSIIYNISKTETWNDEETRFLIVGSDLEQFLNRSYFDPIILVVEELGEEADIVGAVLRKHVTIVPYAQRETLNDSLSTDFIEAYKELRKKDIEDLIPSLKKYYTDAEIESFSITQIFYLGPQQYILDFIDEHDELNLRLIFKMFFGDGEAEIPAICYRNNDKKEWICIDPISMIKDWPESGNLSVDFHHFGTVIFLEKRNAF